MLQTALCVRVLSEHRGSQKPRVMSKFTQEICERARTQTYIHCLKDPFSFQIATNLKEDNCPRMDIPKPGSQGPNYGKEYRQTMARNLIQMGHQAWSKHLERWKYDWLTELVTMVTNNPQISVASNNQHVFLLGLHTGCRLVKAELCSVPCVSSFWELGWRSSPWPWQGARDLATLRSHFWPNHGVPTSTALAGRAGMDKGRNG